MDEAGEVIKAWATEGHSVAIPGHGTMRFGLSAKSVADVNGNTNQGGSQNQGGGSQSGGGSNNDDDLGDGD